MSRIPPPLREAMAADPFYKRCSLSALGDGCHPKIEWHHNLIYGGKQVQEKWCILPLCKYHHDTLNSRTKELLTHLMVTRATDDELKRYSKVINYLALKQKLNEKT